MKFLTRLFSVSRHWVIAVPYVWLLAFFFAPFLIVFKLSFADIAIAIPPYTPLFQYLEEGYLKITMSINNYLLLYADHLYIEAYLNSIKIAFISTVICLFLAFPIAYAMAKAPKNIAFILLMLIILPFWTSFLIRVYAWIGILKDAGILNLVLQNLGIIDQPLAIYNTEIAVYIGIVYSYLPFMILPLYATLERIDVHYIEAATDLGCRPFQVFYTIILPLAVPGILAGCFLVFVPAIGEFVIPDLLGGSDTLMIGKVLWSEFFGNRDWPLASALTVILLILLVLPIVFFQNYQHRSAKREVA